MATYKNSFYNSKADGSRPEISTDAKPVLYKGYYIYERIKGVVWDIVKDGVCIGMYAGLNGAKGYIDNKTTHGKRRKAG